MDVLNEKFLSTVNVPVTISLSDVERQLNTQVTGLVYEDNSLTDNDNDQFLTKVWKRDVIRVQAQQDSVFHFRVPLKIWAKAGMKILGFMQYQETEFELDLKFATRFSIDSDWSVNTRTTAQGYDWVRRPVLKIAGFEVPVTRIIGPIIDRNLGRITETLDQEVRKKVDLKTPVLKIWNTVREPYLVSEKYRTWLQVVPNRVLITPFRFEGNFIRTTIGLEGYTLTQTGPKPEVKPATALPNLVVTPKITEQFKVGLLCEASYREAAQLAAAEFVGKEYTFQDGKYKVTLTDIDLYGQTDNLIIKAGLQGSLNGDIYLRGYPYFDPQTRTISLRNLTYDFETRNFLHRTANWFLQGTLTRTLEKQLSFPVGDQIDEARKSLETRLANNPITKGVILNGKIDQISPDQVYLTAQSLLGVVFASGRMNVRVDGL